MHPGFFSGACQNFGNVYKTVLEKWVKNRIWWNPFTKSPATSVPGWGGPSIYNNMFSEKWQLPLLQLYCYTITIPHSETSLHAAQNQQTQQWIYEDNDLSCFLVLSSKTFEHKPCTVTLTRPINAQMITNDTQLCDCSTTTKHTV